MKYKNKILFFVVIVLSFQLQVNAQIRHLRWVKEELENNNFDKGKVIEKIKKYEKDEGAKAESMYIRSKYLCKNSQNLFELDSAFVYFSDAYRGLESYDQKIKDELCKDISFCELNKIMETNEIESLLFSKYTQSNTISGIELFIAKYPANVFNNKAIRLRDSLEFEKIKPLDDEVALKEFLYKRPNSFFYKSAEDLMFNVAFEKTKASNSIIKYKEYIKNYPKSPKINEAIDFVSTKNWEDIEPANNKELFLQHISEYPRSKFVAIAKQKIEEIDWKITSETDDLSSYEKFAATYPTSSKIDLVNQKIKEFKELVLPYLNGNKKYTLLNIGTLKFIGENEYDTMVAMPKGKFIVSKYKKYGIIDLFGNKITPTTYDCIENSGDFFIVKLSKNYGVLNDQGQKIIDFAFESITKTESNRFIVSKNIDSKKSTYGLISSSGEGLLDAIYSNVIEINSTTYNVTLAGQSFLVDENAVVKSQKYTSISPLDYNLTSNLFCKVELKNKNGLINIKGEVIIPLIYETINEAGNSLIVSSNVPKSGNIYGITDLTGKVLLAPKYKNINYCGNDLFAINTNTLPKTTVENYKLYSITSNTFLTKDSYNSIEALQNGLMKVEKNELIGYINELGETIVSPMYQRYSGDGFFGDAVDEDETCFIIPNNEENITNSDLNSSSNLILVQLADKIGFINNKGEIILPIIFNRGSEFYKGINTVQNETDAKSIIDEKGNVLLDNAEILYYYNNSKSVLAKQEDSFFKIDSETHKVEPYTLLKEMDYIDHYKKYKIIQYKGMDVYVTSKDQILMAKGIDFSDYNYNKKVEEARNLYFSGEYDQAIDQLKSLLNEKSNIYDVPLLLGKCYKAKDDSYSAINYFNQAVNIDPNNTEAYSERYELNYNRKYWSDAKNDIIKLISFNPEYDESLTFNLGYCNVQLNNDNEAFDNYSKVIRNNPKYALAYSNRGLIYSNRGDHQAALSDQMNALKNSKYETNEYKGHFLNCAANELNKLNKKAEACVYWSKGAALGNSGCKQQLYYCK